VTNAGAGRHDLHVPGTDDRSGADAVLVLQRPFEHVGDDLHVAVSVRAEAFARLDAILVDHAQHAVAHVPRIVVIAEGEGVPARKPSKLGDAAIGGLAHGEHGRPL